MNRQSMDAPPDATAVASLSDVGRLRSVNEDSCDSFVGPDGARLLVVADGMGGHRGGATASREAVAAIGRVFEARGAEAPDRTLLRAIDEANARIFALAEADPELAGMGTTVVALLVDGGGRAAVAHVGDSRCYRWRSGRLEPLTVDHSVVAEMLRRGVLTPEEAAFHPRRNEILRSVGVLPAVETEVSPVALEPGDWFLLCSDGLCGVVSDAEIELVLARAPSADDAVQDLVELANAAGGPDNVTVQILSVDAGRRPATDARATDARRAASPTVSPPAAAPSGIDAPAGPGASAAAEPGDDRERRTSTEPTGALRRNSPTWIALLVLLAVAAWWLLGGR
ncbi:MAG: Stp1/IreP family PP2C-type Ser/Thr phosphatase [Myxococcota bacterium]